MSRNSITGTDKLLRNLDSLKKIAKSPIREEALMSGGIVYEQQVKINITNEGLIDTGKMRASVAALIEGANKVIIVVRTFYAVFHEFGTRFIKPRPFLRPPADTHRKQIAGAVAEYLAQQIKRVIR